MCAAVGKGGREEGFLSDGIIMLRCLAGICVIASASVAIQTLFERKQNQQQQIGAGHAGVIASASVATQYRALGMRVNFQVKVLAGEDSSSQ